MKKILYIHGAFSAFKPESFKVMNLSKRFNVHGVSYSMETDFPTNLHEFITYCIEHNIEAVVGTSLGGLYATEISKILNIPSILINPCIEAKRLLLTIVGNQINFTTGKNENFTSELANTYPELASLNENCFAFIGLKDTIINPESTISHCEDHFVKYFLANEDHYWEFFDFNDEIKKIINK